jgi:hypothetical protein
MLLIASPTGVERIDNCADELLRRLAELLPDAWIVAGTVASKPVSDTCRRGYTRPFDAIIIGDRMIFVLDIWSPHGLIANRQKSAFFARISGQTDFPEGWQSFRSEIEKLKAALHDRFEVEPGRIVPEKIWSRAPQFDSAEVHPKADSADLRSFTRAAARLDRASIFAPLHRKVVDRIVTFLTEDAIAAPERRIPFFADESPMPAVVPLRPVTPEEASRPTSPASDAVPSGSDEASEAAAAVPRVPSQSTHAELAGEQGAPISAPEKALRKTSPALDAALPVIAEAAKTAVNARLRQSPPPHVEDALPPAVPIDSLPTPVAQRKEASRPARATTPPAAPMIAKTGGAPTTFHMTGADVSLEHSAPAVASAPAQRRPTAYWKWVVGVILLLLVSQAGTIAWLSLLDRAPPPLEPAPHAARAPAAPVPVPFVVRSMATSEPMKVGSEKVTLRAGPSRDFPAVGELGAGTDIFANGRASGPDGATWFEILAVNGAIGFVPDNKVQPKAPPALAIEGVAPSKQTPAPEIESTMAPTPARKVERTVASTSARKIERAVVSAPVGKVKRELAPTPARLRTKGVPAPARIDCILPGGEEIQTPRSVCRAQSGIIYQ